MPSSDALQWTQVGIGHGGGCPFIKIHPADPNVVFETTDMGTSYMSMDGSRTYRPATQFRPFRFAAHMD